MSGPRDLSSTRLQEGSKGINAPVSQDEAKGVQEPISSVESVMHRPTSTRKGDSHFERVMSPGFT